jgi:protein-disulfide isomerase
VRGTLTALRKKYGGKIRLVYRHLPLTEIHSFAWAAAEASECAAEQGKFWPYHDLVFENAGRLSKKILAELGARAGVRNVGKFKTCVRKGRYKSRVRQDVAAAQTLGMSGTPAFFIGREVGNGMMEGQLLSGAQSLDAFVELVEDALAADRKNGGASKTRRPR